MLSTSGLSPVAQLFPRTSEPSPSELAPVAPEWPITPMASNADVEAAVSVVGLELQAVPASHSSRTIAELRNRCMGAPPVLGGGRTLGPSCGWDKGQDGGWAPTTPATTAAAAWPLRTASRADEPARQPASAPAANASPQPVVSRGGIGSAPRPPM